MLYAPQPYLGRVVRLNLAVKPITPQIITTGLSFPTAVKFDSRGRLFAVASADDGQVVRIDVASGRVHLVATVPTGLSGMDNLAFGPRDELYCPGGADGSVWRILPSGIARNLSMGGVSIPRSVVTAPGRGPGHPVSLYVGNVFSYYKFDARTGHVEDTQWQSFSGGALSCPSPWVVRRRPSTDVLLREHRPGLGPDAAMSLGEWIDLPTPVNAIGFGDDLVIATIGGGGAVVGRPRAAPAPRSSSRRLRPHPCISPPAWPRPTTTSGSPTGPPVSCGNSWRTA